MARYLNSAQLYFAQSFVLLEPFAVDYFPKSQYHYGVVASHVERSPGLDLPTYPPYLLLS